MDHVALVWELGGVVAVWRPVPGSVLQKLDQDLHLIRHQAVLPEALNQLEEELCAQFLEPLVTLEGEDDVLDQTVLTTQHPSEKLNCKQHFHTFLRLSFRHLLVLYGGHAEVMKALREPDLLVMVLILSHSQPGQQGLQNIV